VVFVLLGTLEQHILLAILRKRGNAYGVSIADELEARTNKRHSFGSIYTTLERLKAKGYVAVREGEPTAERGGRAKLYFKLTGKGQDALEGSLNAVSKLRAGIRGLGGART
jgi:PadR family transcriptional regulator